MPRHGSTGSITDLDRAAGLLAAAWPDLDGSRDMRMESRKLGRIESAEWAPPVLSFQIERDGGTVLGSTRAEIQIWHADLGRRTAEVAGATYRHSPGCR
jgi:hypothetical protein